MEPVDLVVLWVDGNDLEWQTEKQKVTPKAGNGEDNRIIRYRDWGLMKYWFRAVEKNLPWINNIYFITCGHLPEWLNTEHPKLKTVKHSDYIPQKYLPTFNSNVIELNIHRIEELSEQFILANDDFFFLNPLDYDFFFKNGLPCDAAVQNVLQFHKSGGIGHIMANNLEWLNKRFKKREVMKKNPFKWFNLRYGKTAFNNLYLLPFSNFTGFYDPHIPYGYLKSGWVDLWNENGEELDRICTNRLRSNTDINHWLIRYRQFAEGRFTPVSPNRGEFLVIGSDDERIKTVLSGDETPTVCLSDDFEDIDFEFERKFLEDLFEKRFPEKSEFEK